MSIKIIGIVADAKYDDVRVDPPPTIYLASLQYPGPKLYFSYTYRRQNRRMWLPRFGMKSISLV